MKAGHERASLPLEPAHISKRNAERKAAERAIHTCLTRTVGPGCQHAASR